METILLWRFIKWLGLLLWGMGVHSVMVNTDSNQKMKALYAFTISGFALTWMSGWMMMKHAGYSMGASWISNAMLLGLVSLTGTFLSAFLSTRRLTWNVLSTVGLFAAIGLMVVRTGNPVTLGLLLGLSVVVGGVLAKFGTSADQDVELDTPMVKSGFQWIARLEGLTVLALFLLYLPAKKILGINLDGGTGMIGWTHGVFVIVYVLSLTFTARALGWSVQRWVLGGISSFFPFGTFIFEHQVFNSTETKSEDA